MCCTDYTFLLLAKGLKFNPFIYLPFIPILFPFIFATLSCDHLKWVGFSFNEQRAQIISGESQTS